MVDSGLIFLDGKNADGTALKLAVGIIVSEIAKGSDGHYILVISQARKRGRKPFISSQLWNLVIVFPVQICSQESDVLCTAAIVILTAFRT